SAWLCSDHVTLSEERPEARRAVNAGDGLPFPYYFVGENGAFGYRSEKDAGQVRPSAELQPGFAVAVTALGRSEAPEPAYAHTTKGLWLPVEDLRPARSSSLRGYEVGEKGLDHGFVATDHAELYVAPGGKKLEGPEPRHFDRVEILETTRNRAGDTWVR